MSKRIVITGLGIVSSIGIGKDAFWQALIKGESGISEITSFDTSVYPTHRGGEVKNFSAVTFLGEAKAKRYGRATQLAISAAGLCLKDSALKLDKVNLLKVGVVMGTTMGESQLLEVMNAAWIKQGVEAVEADNLYRFPTPVLPLGVAGEFNLRGPNLIIPTACAAGNYAVGYACDLIRQGDADYMLAGGADAFSRLAFTGFNRLLAVAPEKCQPFDRNRKGMLVGEGAGVVLLESLESALKRQAVIYAEVSGYGLSCDAHHMTQPEAGGVGLAMNKALQDAGLKPADIDYICAHGTGTPTNDKVECAAIKNVFAEFSSQVAVSSIKSSLGHTMGAASAIETIACCLAIKHDILPPTINFETPDPECDIDCVPNTARKTRVRAVLNNASAFGGNNACLALTKVTSA